MSALVDASIDSSLLDAAQRAFADRGHQRSTLERIAAEAGISRVTLHRRGVTKDALVAALAERAVDRYRRAMWPVLTGPGTNEERLESALTALCGVVEDNRDGEVLTRGSFADPFERLLHDGAEDGSLRALDPREGATALVNLVGQTYLRLRTGHGWSPERARKATLDLALRGVLAR